MLEIKSGREKRIFKHGDTKNIIQIDFPIIQTHTNCYLPCRHSKQWMSPIRVVDEKQQIAEDPHHPLGINLWQTFGGSSLIFTSISFVQDRDFMSFASELIPGVFVASAVDGSATCKIKPISKIKPKRNKLVIKSNGTGEGTEQRGIISLISNQLFVPKQRFYLWK